jgi:hypothetical protein
VTVTGGTINADIGGAFAQTEKGVAIAGVKHLYGAERDEEPVGATVTLKNTTVNGSVWGAYAQSNSGDFEKYFSGNGDNPIGDAYAVNNHVNITDNTIVSGSVYGGIARASEGSFNKADLNNVTVKDSTVSNNIIGGFAEVTEGGTVYRLYSEKNNITVDNSTVGGDIYGSIASIKKGAFIESVYAAENDIYIKGNSAIQGDIVGGLILIDGVSKEIDEGWSLDFHAYANNISLEGAPNLEGVSIYGGRIIGDPENFWTLTSDGVKVNEVPDAFSYNMLLVNDYTGVGKLDTISNFEFFSFRLAPDNHLTPETAVLKTVNLYLGSAPDSNGDITQSKVGYHPVGYRPDNSDLFGSGIQFSGASAPGLREGATISLIAADHAWNYDGSEEAVEGTHFESTNIAAKWGSLFEQELTTHLVDNNIVAGVGETFPDGRPTEEDSPSTDVFSGQVYGQKALTSSLFDTPAYVAPSTTGIEQMVNRDANPDQYLHHVGYASQEGQQATGHSKWRNMTREQRKEAFSKLPEAKQNEIKAKRAAWREAHPEGGRRHHRAQ